MNIRKIAGQPDTNNAEIAAVSAPNPLMFISDGIDWTKHFPQEDFPYVRNIYKLFDATQSVANAYFPNGRHDYGPDYRRLAYEFFSKSLGTAAPPTNESEHIESQSDQAVRSWIHLDVPFPADVKKSSFILEKYHAIYRLGRSFWESGMHVARRISTLI